MDRIAKLASQKAVVIFSKSSCCMSHAIKRLFYDQGVSPAVYELDEDSRGKEIEWALLRLGCNPAVPAVFIGGRFIGSASHHHAPPQWLPQQIAQGSRGTLALIRTCLHIDY